MKRKTKRDQPIRRKPQYPRPVPNPFRYPGSKKHVMRAILPWLPPRKVVVDVFGGTGAVLLSMPQSKLEVFNDLNEDLVNAFRVLQDDQARRRLFRRLSYTLHSRRMFYHCLDLLTNGAPDAEERAWAYLVIGNQARAGVDPSIAGPCTWGYLRKSGSKDRWECVKEYLANVSKRFQSVQIENRPWEQILDLYDSPSTLFMLDPPYPPDVRISKNLYKHEMSSEDHERLLKRVQQIKGLAILFSYDSALYREYLANWRRIEIKTRCFMAISKGPRTEVAWLNYDFRSVSKPKEREILL